MWCCSVGEWETRNRDRRRRYPEVRICLIVADVLVVVVGVSCAVGWIKLILRMILVLEMFDCVDLSYPYEMMMVVVVVVAVVGEVMM